MKWFTAIAYEYLSKTSGEARFGVLLAPGRDRGILWAIKQIESDPINTGHPCGEIMQLATRSQEVPR